MSGREEPTSDQQRGELARSRSGSRGASRDAKRSGDPQALAESGLPTSGALREDGVRQLLDALPALVSYLDREERFCFANRAHEAWFGVPVASLAGVHLRDAIGSAAYARLRVAIVDALSGKTSRIEGTLSYARAGVRHVSVLGIPDLDADEAVRGCYCVVQDLTDLRRVEQAVRETPAQAALAEQFERRALAADLHDDVGQLLSLAALRLSALEGERGASARRLRAQIFELIGQARERVSSLSFQLSPPVLFDVGLRAAARWLAEDLRRSCSLVVEVNDGPELESLNEATRVTLFRALRELLLNVVRHGHTAFAQVSIAQSARRVRLEVRDAGVGFDPQAPCRGFGLASLRGRIEHLGGEMQIESKPGSGVRVRIQVPLSAASGR